MDNNTAHTEHPFFIGLDKLPWPVATRQDLEAGDVTKQVGVTIHGYHFYILDLHNPEDVEKYKEIRLKQINLVREGRYHMKRDATVTLNVNGDQRLHAVLEWVEATEKLYSSVDIQGNNAHNK